jgi:hypothetical protein
MQAEHIVAAGGRPMLGSMSANGANSPSIASPVTVIF